MLDVLAAKVSPESVCLLSTLSTLVESWNDRLWERKGFGKVNILPLNFSLQSHAVPRR